MAEYEKMLSGLPFNQTDLEMHGGELHAKQCSVIANLIGRNRDRLAEGAIEYFHTTFCYRELFDAVDRYAAALLRHGIRCGDVVMVCLPAIPSCLFFFYAINRIGAVANMVNPVQLKNDFTKYSADSDAALLVILDSWLQVAAPEAKDRRGLSTVTVSLYDDLKPRDRIGVFCKTRSPRNKRTAGHAIRLEAFLGGAHDAAILPPEPAYCENDCAAIFYTSGTTGEPKGCCLTNAGINNMIAIYDAMDGFGRKPGDRNLVIIPPFFASGITQCVNIAFAFGCTNVLQPFYDKRSFAADLLRYRPVMVTAAASHWATLLNKRIRKDRLAFLEYPFTGGEPLTVELAQAINERLRFYGVQHALVIGYGMSEFGTLTTVNIDLPNRTNEAGYLLPFVRARIVDARTQRIVNLGEKGIVQIQTPCMMKGYFHDAAATAKFFVEDENSEVWGNTGDIGYIDAQGVLHVKGRANDSFENGNRHTIYLFDIESIASQNPAVRECEAVAMEGDCSCRVALHIVPHKMRCGQETEIICQVDQKLHEEMGRDCPRMAYKIRRSFATNPISGKRDAEALKRECDGFVDAYGRALDMHANKREPST